MRNRDIQIQKAEAFLKLHHDSRILLIANAWDVLSAKISESLGFKAIGTTSAGISATLGFPDGQKMPLEENLRVVKNIADNTVLPVSADIEAGYSVNTEEVVKAALDAINCGAVGINLEDATGEYNIPLFDTVIQVEKIKAIRKMFDNEGIHPVINLRTDVYLATNGDLKSKFEETVIRGNSYLEAGADSIFVPDMGEFDKNLIKDLVKEINGPLNIIAGNNTPSVLELENLGVARLSFGPRPMRTIYAYFKNIMSEIITEGNYTNMSAYSLSYSEVNKMFNGNDKAK